MFQDLFDLGALAVIDIPAGIVISRQGAIVDLVMKGTFTDNWYTYNRGTGQFDLKTSLAIPTDGSFQSTRTNFWNNGGATDRGFLSVEGGGEITKANPVAESDHLRNSPPSGNAFTIQNTGVTVKRGCGQNAGTSTTNSMILSCWVRKADHSVVTSADVHVHMGAASGDWADVNNRCGATTYEPLRDGWTRISAIAPTNGLSTTVAQGIKIAQGLTMRVEFGQHERYISGTPGPTDPIPTDVAGNTDRVRGAMILEAFLRGGTTPSGHFQEGALAIACRPDRTALTQTFGQLVVFGTTETNHGFSLSDSTDAFSYWCRIASVSTSFIDAENLEDFSAHQPIGACAMWGFREGNSEYFLAVNGLSEGAVTSATEHPALDEARLIVGARATAGDVLSSGADAQIAYVAIFDKKPGRAACTLISRKMQILAERFWSWS